MCLPSPFCRLSGHLSLGSGPALVRMVSSCDHYLDYICKDSYCKYSHMLSSSEDRHSTHYAAPQAIPNTSARVVLKKVQINYVTPLLTSLKWLPSQRKPMSLDWHESPMRSGSPTSLSSLLPSRHRQQWLRLADVE